MGSWKVYYQIMKLNKEQESALIGIILGDGYLQKTGSRNARLRLEHRLDHKDYLVWKTKILPELFQGRPTLINRIHPKTQKTYKYARFQSNSSPILGKLRKLFYPQDKKVIPDNLSKIVKSDIALAVWYMDDGYYYPRDKCAYIYLGIVSGKEARIASDVIANTFNVPNRILDKKKKGFVIYFSPSNAKILKEKIKKYIVPVMAYKIPS